VAQSSSTDPNCQQLSAPDAPALTPKRRIQYHRKRPSGKYAELVELLRANQRLQAQMMSAGIAVWDQANRRRVRFQWRGYTGTIYSTFCRFCADYRGRELVCRYH
jgi:hypothetical protein